MEFDSANLFSTLVITLRRRGGGGGGVAELSVPMTLNVTIFISKHPL